MAMLRYLHQCQIDVLGERRLKKVFTRADFSSDRKRMSTIIEDPAFGHVCYIKGASEYILSSCDKYIDL